MVCTKFLDWGTEPIYFYRLPEIRFIRFYFTSIDYRRWEFCIIYIMKSTKNEHENESNEYIFTKYEMKM